MRINALLALLPLLPLLPASAAPHNDHRGHVKPRKSLNFGPHHPHKQYESFQAPLDQFATRNRHAATAHRKRDLAETADVDYVTVAAQFIEQKTGLVEGDGFYIRSDSYTDPKTLITHVYARQLVRGLEVGDGDVNVNVDRDGHILSWGNSFAPAGANFASPGHKGQGHCRALETTIDQHTADLAKADPGAWEFAKAAVKAALGLPIGDTDAVADAETAQRLRISLAHLKDQHSAACSTSTGRVDGNPTVALAALVSRISEGLTDLDPDDIVVSIDHSVNPKPAPAEGPTWYLSGDALKAAGVVADVPARMMVSQSDEGVLIPVFKFEVEMKDNWYEAYVDAEHGRIIRIVDWASDISIDHLTKEIEARKGKGGKQRPLPGPPSKGEFKYHVFPWGVNDPQVGKLETVSEPWDNVASPLGWHTFPTTANPWPETQFKGSSKDANLTHVASTVGNNVIAHEDWEGRNNFLDNYRPVNESYSFVYDYGAPDGLAPREYIDLVVTQLFYTSNSYHDLLHRVGFDEVSGNFQMYNFGKGGRGGDPVICNAQDGSGYNNANFMTPPDGQAPRMRMYVWDTATPYRDGDLEAGIVIHEYSHGLTTRLTGGPMNSGCLGWGEAGGMGEGWGDAIATIIRQVEEHQGPDDVFPMGAWAANQAGGIRNYIYSTNSTINPSTYKTLDQPGYWGVHAIGEVWAELLFTLNQRLIEKYGFSKTLFPPEDTNVPNDYYTSISSVDEAGRPLPLVPKHGNTLALQLIVSALKLQPCRPSFFDARDAIVSADKALTGGANACLIWNAFAERGLGTDAEIIGNPNWGGVRKDGYKVPPGVCPK